MEAEKGWIKLFRSLLDNELWKEAEPFDRRSAWIDLLLLAEYEDHTGIVKGAAKKFERGTVYHSIDFFSKRWKWSKGRVRRYFDLLSDTGMCIVSSTTNGTTISLVKWRDFQDARTTDGTTDSTTDGTTDGTTGGTHLKKIKKNKEEKKTHTQLMKELMDKMWKEDEHGRNDEGANGGSVQ